MTPEYAAFLATKAPRAMASGIQPGPSPEHLFGFQAATVNFCLRQGRAAVFLATGLGKTRIQLDWCDQAAAASNGRALILTPLAVARQIEREGQDLGYEVRVIRRQDEAGPGINVCNYDRLDDLDADAFGAVSLDESSILKSIGGKRAQALIERFSGHRFRLAATATPAPNDIMELTQHAEFLGIMSGMEMLSRWFINDTSKASQEWRLKGHAQESFWGWVASWARMADSPADLGFPEEAEAYVLPSLQVVRHHAAGDVRAPAGALFVQELSATTMHDLKRQTAEARAEAVAALVAASPGEPWVVWADTDYETAALMRLLPSDAVEVRGSMPVERKESALADFAEGRARIMVSKPSVCGFGLNWQHACRVAFVGRSFSYEQWYQAVRRCWRFGQKRPVTVHLIVAEGEDQIGRVIDRKAADHAAMKAAMANAMQRAASQGVETKVPYAPRHIGRVPAWLKSAA
jgi:hypothetical protein